MNGRIGRMAALFLLLGLSLLSGQEVIDEVVAVVNGEIITRAEVKARYEMLLQALRAQAGGQGVEEQVEFLKKNLLDRMVTELLILQKARQLKLDVREQVRLTIDNIKSQNGMESDDDLRAALRREGLDYNSWVKQMEEDLLRQAVLFNEVDRQIVLDDSDVVNEYKSRPEDYTAPEEVRLSGILVSDVDHSAEEVEARKSEIVSRLAGSEDFAALAEALSDGPVKDSRGDLGTFKKGELDPVLEEAVRGMKAGQVSGWLRARNGWYLLRLESRKESALKPFDGVKKEIEEKIFNRKRAKAIEDYVAAEKARNSIAILRPNVLDY
jgi:parvulin-like peptidyl-prolyl isomerase